MLLACSKSQYINIAGQVNLDTEATEMLLPLDSNSCDYDHAHRDNHLVVYKYYQYWHEVYNLLAELRVYFCPLQSTVQMPYPLYPVRRLPYQHPNPAWSLVYYDDRDCYHL